MDRPRPVPPYLRFVVPSDLILGNSGTAPSGFEIDFCDGAGMACKLHQSAVVRE